MIYTDGKNTFLMPHVPRTGGRHVKKMFENSNLQVTCYKSEYINGHETTHAHFHDIFHSFELEDLPETKIVICRNPTTKFFSALKYFDENSEYSKTIRNLDSKENFSYFMKDMYIRQTNAKVFDNYCCFGAYNLNNNWFKHQYYYLNRDIHIWKYEYGFGKNFVDWFYDRTNILIEHVGINEYRRRNFDENKEVVSRLRLNKKVIQNIRDFYEDDYIFFEYD